MACQPTMCSASAGRCFETNWQGGLGLVMTHDQQGTHSDKRFAHLAEELVLAAHLVAVLTREVHALVDGLPARCSC